MINEKSAKKHVEEIKESYTKDGRILNALTGAMSTIEKMFPRVGHFLLEFIQNADDAGAKRIEISLIGDRLIIYNDGVPLSRDDVEAMCSIGRSRKDPSSYLGYLGVGFKSIFLMSDNPHVYSIPYRFKFDKNAWQDYTKIPWQITPIWLDEIPSEFRDKLKERGVIFYIPLKREGIERIKEELESLKPRTLLFLRSLNKMELQWNGKKRVIEKSLLEKERDYEIYQIRFQEDEKIERTNWVVFRYVVLVPEEVRENMFTKEWNRERVEKREIAFAFRLTEDLDLTPEPSGTIAFGVFSHVPTREVEIGLPFMLHADFLTAPGRDQINFDALWNSWLLREAVEFVKRIVKIFQGHEKWRFSYTNVLLTTSNPYKIRELLLEPIERYIKESPCLVDRRGELVVPKDSIWISEHVIMPLERLGKDFIEEFLHFIEKYSGKKLLHEKCKPHGLLGVQKILRIRDYRINVDRIKGVFGEKWLYAVKLYLTALAMEFFSYSEATQKSSEYRSMYQAVTPVLDEDGNICNFSDIVLPIDDEVERRAKESFPGRYKFLHPALRTELIIKYLMALGIKILRLDELEHLLKKERVPRLVAGLSDLLVPDNEKISYIKTLKEFWERKIITSADLKGILVRTKSGRWMAPEKILFSSEYMPEEDIEKLIKKGFLDWSYEFLDPVFIKGETHEGIISWRNFFSELGLGREIEKSKIVQRVGVFVALRYEKEKCDVKDARELSESEARNAGFDIISKMPDGSPKFIEVKARTSPFPIQLTKSETKKVLEESDRTFVYIVADALSSPKLYILPGKSVAKLVPLIEISPSDWDKLAMDVWTPY